MLRFLFVVWILGAILFGLVALSSYLYSTDPERTQRLHMRLRMALLWPIAVLSSAGRARLRRG
jgi:hypothetical protein